MSRPPCRWPYPFPPQPALARITEPSPSAVPNPTADPGSGSGVTGHARARAGRAGGPSGPGAARRAARALCPRRPGRPRRPPSHRRRGARRRHGTAAARARPGHGRRGRRLLPRRRAGTMCRARRRDDGRAARGPRPGPARAHRARHATLHRRRSRSCSAGRAATPTTPAPTRWSTSSAADRWPGSRRCSPPRCWSSGAGAGSPPWPRSPSASGCCCCSCCRRSWTAAARWRSPSSAPVVIMFAVLYLTHGLSARTSTAVLGTLVSLALIGLLGRRVLRRLPADRAGRPDHGARRPRSAPASTPAGWSWPAWSSERSGCSTTSRSPRPARCGSFAGANPQLHARALFRAAMRIGRDHVASAVNTLVLAYAGASLPLLLLFSLSGRSLGDVATSQDVATEIVRTLVGSIGLVASVPVTTAVAALVASREDPEGPDVGGRAGSPRRRARGRAVSRGRAAPPAAPPAAPGTAPARRRPRTAR